MPRNRLREFGEIPPAPERTQALWLTWDEIAMLNRILTDRDLVPSTVCRKFERLKEHFFDDKHPTF